MRFATLTREPALRDQVTDALASMGIEVLNYATVDALLVDMHAHVFDAILVEDLEDRIGHWLGMLQPHTGDAIALLAVGAGGTAAMSRALRHGADDYVLIDEGAAQLVDRAVARIGAKIQRSRQRAWRLGPYTLDGARSSLASSVAEVHLPPRVLLLARALMENQGRVVALERLCEHLCARTDAAARRAVKQHAHVLRKKCLLVAVSTAEQLRVEAVYGQGYRLTL
jgi:DNA-binding response OmpR family regulator